MLKFHALMIEVREGIPVHIYLQGLCGQHLELVHNC